MSDDLLSLASRCIRCGFCQDACPTYKLTASETASPRGRIRLMVSVTGEGKSLTPDLIHAMDLCLGCRACETACPSGVEYGRMLEIFRHRIEASSARPRVQHASKAGLIAMMERPAAFAASLKIAAGARRVSGNDPIPSPIVRAITGGKADQLLMPTADLPESTSPLPEISPASGKRRHTVAILPGCVMQVLYDRVHRATIRVLQKVGCDVLAPRALGCCGALDIHAGFLSSGLERARAFLRTLQTLDYDAFVVNSAGCGSTLTEYGDLLADDPVHSYEARTFAAKVVDISTFLDDHGPLSFTGRFERTVAYHDACHLAHGQRVVEPPRRLLEQVPGLRLVPLAESDLCCGSAGTYNITQPDMAKRLLDRKVDNILKTGAEIVAMGNPGCMAWIQTGLQERGSAVRIMHTVEIVDAAL